MIASHTSHKAPVKAKNKGLSLITIMSFVIQVKDSEDRVNSVSSPKLNFSAMKLFNRFRKVLMRLVFSGKSNMGGGGACKEKNCERFEPPKTSCSSYYSSHSHYSEAIADCIEFFNKSAAQEGISDGRRSDVLV
ncbi:hypothetical protein E1A91_A06G004800v1 [Gossypium mustelinum]|uniref:Uncharacterized protein n=4 Tax=Gossypium TaxID=3633 RepID=A0ABR0PHH4_GOSAR|nr:hypothetical protein ES319_A06G004700v1 [Gossypium barbadense]KAK5823780.1 hypothetical protein PVK06_018543 [Gossypium arboreum]TYH11694.1 hypothetical protein ES288_A06G006200v1 [Gossypium darwinii]TYJ28511.1 hypothetical protein E1A91_A06G004800v1 [Gossypium mustelinum]